MLCGVFVFMAVNERASRWRVDAHRLWLAAEPQDGGPDRGPSTLNAKALAKTVGVEFEGTDHPEVDDFLVAAILSKQFEEESGRIHSRRARKAQALQPGAPKIAGALQRRAASAFCTWCRKPC